MLVLLLEHVVTDGRFVERGQRKILVNTQAQVVASLWRQSSHLPLK